MPGGGLLGVAGIHQRQQRKGGVAQPAEAIVPVSRAAELFRQRGRRRGDDAAGRLIGQRLQRDQRSHHQVAVVALIGAVAAPVGPELLGVLQRLRGIDRFGHRQMRRPIGQHEGNGFAFARPRNRPPWSGPRRGSRPAFAAPSCPARKSPAARRPRSPDPGDIGAEAEADHQLHPQLHPARTPRTSRTTSEAWPRGGMKSIRATTPARRLEARLQDQRIVPVAARAFVDLFRRRDQPSAVVARAQAARRNRHRNRMPASTASRSTRRDRPVPRSRNRRSIHSLRFVRSNGYPGCKCWQIRSRSAPVRGRGLERGDVDRGCDVVDRNRQPLPPVRMLVDGAGNIGLVDHAQQILQRDREQARPGPRQKAATA